MDEFFAQSFVPFFLPRLTASFLSTLREKSIMRFRLPIKPDEIPVDEKQQPNDDEANVTPQSASKEAATSRADQVDDDKSDVVNPEFQHGVQSAQAMTQVWSKQHLILAYVM